MTSASDVAAVLGDATVRYSRVWEDADVLRAALDVRPDDDVLAICSAGDNVLALLLDGPATITAVDLNPAQTAILDLKLTALRHGTWDDLASVLGHPAGSRPAPAAYADLRARLPAPARAFWDARPHLVSGGILDCGRLDTYFTEFAAELPAAWPPGLLDRLLAAGPTEQAALFRAHALTDALRALFVRYFGRGPLAARGRDEVQFKHVPGGDLVDHWLARFTHSMTTHHLAANDHVRRFLGVASADPEAGPAYLRPSNFERLAELAPRARVHLGAIDTALDRTYSKGAFSDLFEYLSADETTALFRTLVASFRPGGRLAWWNLLVPRPTPDVEGLRALRSLAESLHARDRVFFYRAFHVAETT